MREDNEDETVKAEHMRINEGPDGVFSVFFNTGIRSDTVDRQLERTRCVVGGGGSGWMARETHNRHVED